jgi:hypothetical protein
MARIVIDRSSMPAGTNVNSRRSVAEQLHTSSSSGSSSSSSSSGSSSGGSSSTHIPVPAYGSDVIVGGQNVGKALYDPNTGLALTNPNTSSGTSGGGGGVKPPNIPIPAYGSDVIQNGQNVGKAMYDPNTGLPLTKPTSPEEDKISSAEAKLKKITADNEAAYTKFVADTNAIVKGSVPLTSGEKAQVEGLRNQYQQMIDEQTRENTASTGVAQTRGYQTGSAEYDPSFQNKIIGSIFTAGANKIADLNTKMASSIATLTKAFKDDKIKQIKDAYDEYKDYEKERTDTLQKTVEDTQKQIKAVNDAKIAADKVIYDQAKDKKEFDQKAYEFLTKSNLDERELAHKLVVDATGVGVSGLDDAALTMLAKGYLTSGTLPAVGYGKAASALRLSIVNRAVELSGGNENVNPAVNKAMYDANKATLLQQQKNYAVADTAFRIFDKNGNLALNLIQGLNKANSPAINQLSNAVINQLTGQGQLDSFKAVVTSLQAEYATLISVKGGGAGVTTEGDKNRAIEAIPDDISPNRLKQVLQNLKLEGQNVLNERQQTIDQLGENIRNSANAFNVGTAPMKESFQQFYDSHPALQQQIDQFINQNPNLSDEEVMQIIGEE